MTSHKPFLPVFAVISIHAPAKGVTVHRLYKCPGKLYFNPRSREGSDWNPLERGERPDISIHAPAKGVTNLHNVLSSSLHISIHAPAKGVTYTAPYNCQIAVDFNPRSREGSDVVPRSACPSKSYFNPRSREGSDGLKTMQSIGECRFQSTLPRRE